MIFVHELGHFLAARACGVQVLEFAIGMGPAIFKHKSKRSGTVYSLRIFPLGGFNSLLGEDEEVELEKSEEEGSSAEASEKRLDPRALTSRPRWQRLIILLAGSFMNVLTGMLAMFVVVCMQPGYNNSTVYAFQYQDKYYYECDQNASYAAGLRGGDRITHINNQAVNGWTDIVNTISLDGTAPLDITVIRDGNKLVIEDVKFPVEKESGVSFGVVDFVTEYNEFGFFDRVGQTVERSFATVKTIYKSLVKMISGAYGLEGVSGPVGTVGTIGEAVSSQEVEGFRLTYVFYLFSFVSINLGVMNLLPIPALDGGRILFVLIEMIRRKPIDKKYEGMIHLVGMALLLAFMVIITVSDVSKFFR